MLHQTAVIGSGNLAMWFNIRSKQPTLP